MLYGWSDFITRQMLMSATASAVEPHAAAEGLQHR